MELWAKVEMATCRWMCGLHEVEIDDSISFIERVNKYLSLNINDNLIESIDVS